jgi:CRP/FNR family transcriptional regulator, cyclic AMP receptor protein
VPTGGLWALLDEADRRDLLALGQPRRYPPGRVVIGQGERTDHVILITSGQVKVFHTTEDGREPVLGVRGPGDTVGELAALDADVGGRGAAVVAMDAVEAQQISAAQFRDYLATHPSAATALLRMVVGRLRSADRRRVEYGGFETTSRLAHLLAELAAESATGDTSDVEVHASQHELAAMIGASRESVARALARLRDEGLVASRRRGVVLLDVEALGRHGR